MYIHNHIKVSCPLFIYLVYIHSQRVTSVVYVFCIYVIVTNKTVFYAYCLCVTSVVYYYIYGGAMSDV